MAVIALILSIGLGFGLACFLFASLLSKSNNIGDSVGEAEQYHAKAIFDQHLDDEYSKSKSDIQFRLSHYQPNHKAQIVEPPSDKLVEITHTPKPEVPNDVQASVTPLHDKD